MERILALDKMLNALSRRERGPLVWYGCPRETLEDLAEASPVELGFRTIEPLQLGLSLLVLSDVVHVTLVVRPPNLFPHAMLRIAGEIGTIETSGDLCRARSVERVVRWPEARFEGISLGLRRDLLKNVHADGLAHFGLILNEATLLPERSSSGLPPITHALYHPEFVVRRLRDENAALVSQLRELEKSFDSVLETTCSSPTRDGPQPTPHDLSGISAAIGAIISRGDPAELRPLQCALASLLSSASSELDHAESCAVCMERRAAVLFIPCAHVCCCAACAPPLKQCPLCRVVIGGQREWAPEGA